MTASKPTMAFVDHSFHKTTGSADFYIKEFLAPHFEITRYQDEAWHGGKHVAVSELNKYEYVFFCQIINPLLDLRKLKAKIIWAPMYGGVRLNYFYWKSLSYLPIKILCFSERIYERCQKFGIDVLKVRYFLDPDAFRIPLPPPNKIIPFFWYRGSITFADLKKIIDPKQIDSFIYKSNPDPFCQKEIISADDIKNFKMRIIEGGYSSKEEYLALLSEANVFIAPREKEGIGMSFLEAMAMGQCVIANNDATMNEYIKHEYTGYLFDLQNPKMLDFSHLESVIHRSQEKARSGYEEWEEDRKKVVPFIESHASI